jgi:hypothetical protein
MESWLKTDHLAKFYGLGFGIEISPEDTLFSVTALGGLVLFIYFGIKLINRLMK